MDYTGFHEFPFPSNLSGEDIELKNYFMALPDEDQLNLLNGSKSYQEFHDRVANCMKKSS